MRNPSYIFLVIWVLVFLLSTLNSCGKKQHTLFQYIPADQSGIRFSNDIVTSDTFNILNFHYIYNGGGVGIGDFDKDGLPDMVFTGNQVASKLYLNQGNLTFKDITQSANFIPKGWATGVSIVDINADGWQDIYISVGGLQCDDNCKNQFFIHQGLDEHGLPIFKEMAAEYGLADGLYTQQAAFFDYDSDGDLDVYLLRNLIDPRDKNTPSPKRYINKKSQDALFENVSILANQPQFKEVSQEQNITHRGYGLGIAINDFNQDGRPDIYIANDFLSEDALYLNTAAAGFTNVSKQVLKHTTYNAMGVEVADINNDALPDIFTLDMMPEYHERQKTMSGFMNYNKYLLAVKQNYTPQFIRNTLQIHNGFLNNTFLPFSEVGYMTGLYNTDWSWAPLLADFDNDGDKDVFITNGYGKDITDLDFINYSNQNSQFGSKEYRQQLLLEAIQKMEDIKMPNYFFENEGALSFKNRVDTWLPKQYSISNGAVYADLDNDGDLDIVVNNINENAYLLENTNTTNNYLKIQLDGLPPNSIGMGARIQIWKDSRTQMQYQSTVKGYLSSVDHILHFGIGTDTIIDSLKVFWQDGKITELQSIATNQLLKISQRTAKEAIVAKVSNESQSILQAIGNNNLIGFDKHQENYFQDYNAQHLLLQQLSKQGPCLAAANIDKQVGEELFIGGAKGISSQLYVQQKNGIYSKTTLPDSISEDTDAALFDADQDGDIDLYVVSGGTEKEANHPIYQDRLYLNDGQGKLAESPTFISPANNSGSCVRPCDYDKDGDMDIFVGGRVVPQKYPTTPKSYLLVNHNKRFIDHTNKLAPKLETIGMVTDAVWTDYDQDGWQDLIVVGEWMPITLFHNKKGVLHFDKTIDSSAGFWNCIIAADFDQDGDDDYILGNRGLNTRLQASAEEPLYLYKADFDKNGSPDPLIGQSSLNKEGQRQVYPIHARDDVVRQLVKIKSRYRSYEDFGQATFHELLQTDKNEINQLTATHLASSYLENTGNNTFALTALPQAAQLAPIQNALSVDIDEDGVLEVLLSGNDLTAESNGGRLDAFNGLVLKYSGAGDFIAMPIKESGFLIEGDGRDIVQLTNKEGKKRIVVGQNTGETLLFERSRLIVYKVAR